MKKPSLSWTRRGYRATAVVALVAAMLTATLSSDGAVTLNTNVAAQIRALIAEKESRTPAQRKLDSQLIYAIRQSRGEAAAPGVTALRVPVQTDAAGKVVVDIRADVGADLIAYLQQLNGEIVVSSARFREIRAKVPLNRLEELSSRADVQFIRVGTKPDYEVGSLTSEGDVTQKADQARVSFGVDGTGVKVGVLSDSVDFLSQSQATGDAPPVYILPGQDGVGAGEGTAMIEIIHDLAPGAEIFFATAGNGEASFAENILNLRAAGCDIIVDDVRYATESPMQDGIIAQAVNTVTVDGALYFASAGNSGNKNDGTSGTWEGDFEDGGAVTEPVNARGGNYHAFGTNNFNTATASGGTLSLFWADPLGGSTNDYDLFLLDEGGTNVVASSTTTQDGTQDPFEITGGAFAGERVVVVRVTGDARFLHVDSGRGRLELNTAGFGRGHSAASNAFATAAIDVRTSFPNAFVGGTQNPVETFSSDGPRRIFFEADGTPITPGNFLATGGYVRPYPTIAASDGVQTTVPGFDPFFGTSAAAPHAAAVAALLKSYNPALTPEEVRHALTNSALDIEDLGIDRDSGAGIVVALESLAGAPLPFPQPDILIASSFITGGNGNGMIEYNECNDLNLVLTNVGRADATMVSLTLSTVTPGVFVLRPQISIPNIPTSGSYLGLAAFQISTSPGFVCGTTVQFKLEVKSRERTKSLPMEMPTGTVGIPTRFESLVPVPIPDAQASGTNSSIVVSGVVGAIKEVAVALHIQHPFDSDLTLQLIAPDGTTSTLAAGVGGNGANFGESCDSDAVRTGFRDSAATAIGAGAPPFIGIFRPQTPLSVFQGKYGQAVNGEWKLRVVDDVELDEGSLQCWSLTLYPVICVDGGGQCPGTDLALGVGDNPDPVVVGSNLVYTITVTNLGPNSAAGTVLNQNLPGSVLFLSATTTMGTANFFGGAVVANLGIMQAGAVATVTVTVRPLVTGTIVSGVNVASLETELNPPNNTASVVTTVVVPSADLSVSLAGAPNPTTVGGLLAYTATVQNQGPSPASGVVITNTLPASVLVAGASSTQGSVVVSGNTVIALIGSLQNSATATVTISTVPLAAGTIFATSRVVGNLVDPQQANNISTVATTIGEAADVAISLASPSAVVIGSNIAYVVTITNRGPNAASQVTVNQSLSPSLTVSSNSVSQGSVTLGSGVAVWSVGMLPVGGSARMTIVGRSAIAGTLNTVAAVNGAQADPNTANNITTGSTLVAAPFVSIASAGASLITESVTPANGALDVGETVTMEFRLRNAGNAANTNNLTVTLLPGGGVTNQSAPVNYGILSPVGGAGSGAFTFTVVGTNGGRVNATLQVAEGASVLTNIVFGHDLPRLHYFTNVTAINIPDSGAATPYPSTLLVSGVTGRVGQVLATLRNMSHTFAPDADVLLVSPTGEKVMLMGGAGNPFGVVNATITFDDAAAQALPQNAAILSGSYRPANYGTAPSLSAPAPAGPYSTGLSAFSDSDPNGTWSLYVRDRGLGDSGVIASGWSLDIKVIDLVNETADVAVSSTLAAGSGSVGEEQTWTITVTNIGPAVAHDVVLTNSASAQLQINGASVSRGTLSSVTVSQVVCNIGELAANDSAQVTVSVTPLHAGLATYISVAGALETDLDVANNVATLSNANALPVADLAVGLTVPEVVAVVDAIFTATVTVTNHGLGDGLDSTATLPSVAGLVYDSAVLSQGTFQIEEGNLVCSFGTMAPGTVAVASVALHPVSAGGTVLNATVSTGSTDTNAANNDASVDITSRIRMPIIMAAGAVVMVESRTPANGAIEPGETVSVSMLLTNGGELPTTNLQAVLQPGGGVQPVAGTQSYGVIPPGGSVARTFVFTSTDLPAAEITATLLLSDNASPLGSATFDFTLSSLVGYTNPAAIVIPNQGAASPYASVINVTGLTGSVSQVRIALNQLTHSFPSDIDALLVGPQGQGVLLVSDAGGGWSVTNLTLVLDDGGLVGLPENSTLKSGTFKPTDYLGGDVLPAPAPVGPFGSTLGALDGADPNGSWQLYVADDSVGDAGAIAGGWTLSFLVINPVNAVVPEGPFSLAAEFDAGENVFSITLTGQSGASYLLQSSTELKEWSDVETGTAAANGVLKFSDIYPAGPGGQFYRAIRQLP